MSESCSLVYVLISDISDEDEGEEPFDKDKFEGAFSSLAEVERYIRECIDENTVKLQWQPMVTFEHTPYLQAQSYIVHIATMDEGTWRSLGKTVMAAPVDGDGNVNRATMEEVDRLAGYFSVALNLTLEEFREQFA